MTISYICIMQPHQTTTTTTPHCPNATATPQLLLLPPAVQNHYKINYFHHATVTELSSSPNFEDFFQLEISQNQIVIDADEKAFDQLVIVVKKHQNVFTRRGYLRFHLLKARQKKK